MTVRLADIAEFINGGAWSQDEYTTEGIPVVRVTNLKPGGVDLADCKFLPNEALAKYSKHTLRKGDLIIYTVGSHPSQLGSVVGRPCIAPMHIDGALLNQNAVLIRVSTASVDQRWLGYFGQSKPFRDYVVGCARGSANQVRMAIGLLKKMPIVIPSIDEQRRVASILGAYDDLIEVNLRRIALLDEMGRRIFEDAILHFSDADEGTDVATLVITTLGGDWGEERATTEQSRGVRIIRGTDFRRIQSGNFITAPTRFISERSFERRSLRAFDVVVENSINAKSRNAGTPLLISAGTVEALGGAAVATNFCRLFRCSSHESALVLFHFMNRMQRNDEMQQFQVVATNGIANFQSEHFMKRAVIPVSPSEVGPLGRRLASFSSTTFQRQLSILVQQRDLLLPRLISGELSVATAERELEAVA